MGVPVETSPSNLMVSPDDFLLFQSSFQKFVRVFAAVTRSIVLVSDDVQWADQGSLQLLKALLNDTRSRRRRHLASLRVGPQTNDGQSIFLHRVPGQLSCAGFSEFEDARNQLGTNSKCILKNAINHNHK